MPQEIASTEDKVKKARSNKRVKVFISTKKRLHEPAISSAGLSGIRDVSVIPNAFGIEKYRSKRKAALLIMLISSGNSSCLDLSFFACNCFFEPCYLLLHLNP